MQLRQKIKAILKKNDIPRGLVTALVPHIYPSDFSAWLNGRRELNATKQEQLRAAVEKIETLLALSPFGVNFKDVDSVKFAIHFLRNSSQRLTGHLTRSPTRKKYISASVFSTP
jgi:hypothetical protein